MKEKNNKNKLKKIIIFIVIVAIFLIYDFTPLIKGPLGHAKFGSESCTKYQYYQTKKYEQESSESDNKKIKEVKPIIWEDKDHPLLARTSNYSLEM